jgi:hypothetical protein
METTGENSMHARGGRFGMDSTGASSIADSSFMSPPRR